MFFCGLHLDGCHFEDVFEQSNGKEHRCFYNFINENSLHKSRPSWHGWNPGPTEIYRQVSGFVINAFLTRYNFLQHFFNKNPKQISTEIHQPTTEELKLQQARLASALWSLQSWRAEQKTNRRPETEKEREIPVTSGLGSCWWYHWSHGAKTGISPEVKRTSNTCSINTESGVSAFFVRDCLMNSYEVAELSMQYFVIKSIVYDQSYFM